MTEINDFLWKINKTPSFLAEVDWREETNWFDEDRIMLIIKGIKDDEVCKLVRDYIAASWYDACDEAHDDEDIFNCVCPNNWLYLPVENDVDEEYELLTIEYVMDKFMVWRKAAFRRQTKKQTLKSRAREIEISLRMIRESQEGIVPFVNDDIFANHYYNENIRLTAENEQLKKNLEESEKAIKLLQKRLSSVDVGRLLEHIISYAEKFPSTQNEKAEVIKEVLMSKLCNGIISNSIMSSDLMYRLTNLGRKEPPGLRVDNLTANNLYDVHNNGEVKL